MNRKSKPKLPKGSPRTRVEPPHQPIKSKDRFLDILPAVLGVAITLYILLTTLIVIRTCYFPIPLSDQWDEWRLFLATKNYGAFLFNQHNEHRIALARIFFYVDDVVFHARNTFLFFSMFLIQAITGVTLWRLTTFSGTFSRASKVVLGCFIIACLFSAQQFSNFTWGFQVQFVAVYCTAIGALFALARSSQSAGRDAHGRHRPEAWLALACILAILSTYSMSNGLLLWPLLLGMSFWLRSPVRHRIILGAGMAVLSVLCTLEVACSFDLSPDLLADPGLPAGHVQPEPGEVLFSFRSA